MRDEERADLIRYRVVVNHEEQYSLWPSGRELPLGWTAAGFDGTRAECLEHIARIWTDMRPASLREAPSAEPGRERHS
jgi:MbtH protein